MKRYGMTMVLLLAAGLLLGAQEQQQSADQFFQQLQMNLQERGWNEEEIANFTDAARQLEWKQARLADPEVVALALHYTRQQDRDEDNPAGLERAQMALQTALTAREMELAGFNEREIARTTLESTREMLGVIREWRAGPREENLGNMLRERVAKRIREKARNHAEEQLRNRNRAGMRHGFAAAGDGGDDWPGPPEKADPE